MFKPGDLVFVEGNYFFISDIIKFLSKKRSEDITFATHIMGFVSETEIVESDIVSRKFTFDKNTYPYKFEVYRYEHLGEKDLEIIVNKALSYVNKKYGYFKILTSFLDMCLEKIFNKKIFLFRKLNNNDNYPICSWIWADAYRDVGITFDVELEMADPDSMHDYVKNNLDWTLIYKN
jgi:hypothetical protein